MFKNSEDTLGKTQLLNSLLAMLDQIPTLCVFVVEKWHLEN